MTSDDAARRERAEWWVTWYMNDERNIEEPDEQLVFAYLAGASKETEIKDAEIERLKYENEALIGCANSIADELAALREAVRWHNHHERGVPMPKAAKEARRRALEIEP